MIRELENISPGAVRKIIETANYAHSYANTARILLKNQNQPPKNLYEFMLLCESLSDDKILLKKASGKKFSAGIVKQALTQGESVLSEHSSNKTIYLTLKKSHLRRQIIVLLKTYIL